MSQMRPGDFRFTGAFFLSRTHKTTVHTATSLHCSCPADRNKGNLLLAPATLSNTVREAKKKLGFFLFYRGRFDGNTPINRKAHRNGIRNILDSSLTADEKITTLCEKHLNIPPWRDPSGLINAYNPSLRPMTAKAIYRDAVTSEGVQPVTRSISQNQLRFKPTYGECSSPL